MISRATAAQQWQCVAGNGAAAGRASRRLTAIRAAQLKIRDANADPCRQMPWTCRPDVRTVWALPPCLWYRHRQTLSLLAVQCATRTPTSQSCTARWTWRCRSRSRSAACCSRSTAPRPSPSCCCSGERICRPLVHTEKCSLIVACANGRNKAAAQLAAGNGRPGAVCQAAAATVTRLPHTSSGSLSPQPAAS